jgi:hypothetical protein
MGQAERGGDPSTNKLTRDAWVRLLQNAEFTAFATLTFDPKRVFPVSRQRAESEFRKFMASYCHLNRLNPDWLAVVERHQSGIHHLHVGLVGLSLPQVDLLLDSWRNRNGLTRGDEVYNQSGMLRYLLKGTGSRAHAFWSDGLQRRLKLARQSAPADD